MVSLSLSCISDDVGHHRRNPDGIEAHILNIIQVVRNSIPCSSTIFLV